MPHCQNCGATVTARFCAVMGDNTDTAHACPNCTTTADLTNDAAAGFDPAERSRYHGNGTAPGDGGATDGE